MATIKCNSMPPASKIATQAQQVVCTADVGRRRECLSVSVNCLHLLAASYLRRDTFWGGLPLRAFAAFGSILSEGDMA
jgi:hypothetical protein